MAASYPHAAPMCKSVFEKSSFLHEKSRHEKIVCDHVFNHSITVVLPESKTLPPAVLTCLEEERCYKVRGLHPHRLLDTEFIEGFLKPGHFYGLSSGTRIDTDDCLAVEPNGTLILHISKDTYELLGLEGKPSSYSRGKRPSKYVVELDLKSESMAPGKKKHGRVLECLKERMQLTFDFLVLWVPLDEAICASSIQKYFLSMGYEVTEAKCLQKTQWHSGAAVPVVQSGCWEGKEDGCGSLEVFEWLGGLVCSVDMESGGPDNYYSSLSCPTPSIRVSGCLVFQAVGLFSCQAVCAVLHSLREMLTQQGDARRWASLTVHGWADAPVSWRDREHGFFVCGDNLYSFLLFPTQDYWLHTCLASHDLCQ